MRAPEGKFDLAFRHRAARATPRGCLLLLHGVGGNETDLAGLAAATDPEWLVVLPRGPIALGPGQFAWFRVGFAGGTPHIDAAAAETSRLALIEFVSSVQAAFDVVPGRTVISGFSQGGIMSASVALSAPESVAAFAMFSGRILPELAPHIAAKERLAALRAFIGHGEYDRTLPVSWAHRADALLRELGVEHTTRIYPIGHELGRSVQEDFFGWLATLSTAAHATRGDT